VGLIRKTLSVGTAGVVKGSSKKQRVAKSTERAARSTERAARSTAAAGAAAAAAADLAQHQAAELASREHRFRYDTDLTYRAWCEKETADKERNAQAILRARGILRAPGDHVVLDSRKFRGQRAIVLRQELDTGLCRVRLTDGKEISRISPKHLLVHVADVRANPEPEVRREPEVRLMERSNLLWRAGDQVVLDVVGYRGKRATVAAQNTHGSCRIKLDSGKKYLGMVPAEKMHFAALDSGPAEGAPGVPPPG